MVLSRYSDGLGIGTGPSRFVPDLPISDPRSYQAIYAAQDVDTAFAETFLRDSIADQPGDFPIDIGNLLMWDIVEMQAADVDVADLRVSQMMASRVASDALHGVQHKKGQDLGLELHGRDPKVNGIVFNSRFTNSENIMIFDRAKASCLFMKKRTPIMQCPDFAATIVRFKLSLV